MLQIVLIIHNVRSCYNVGSLLRTADGLGVDKVYLTGYTPYPTMAHDSRLPHLATKIDRQIHKTALGAEHSVSWEYNPDITKVIEQQKASGSAIVALEQTATSVPLQTFQPPQNVALIVGREVEGIEQEVLALADAIVEIPMRGQKESFNVAAAAAMALYRLVHR
jgi:tRNA G18 (ribose-2'-O)-methylase SpoU